MFSLRFSRGSAAGTAFRTPQASERGTQPVIDRPADGPAAAVGLRGFRPLSSHGEGQAGTAVRLAPRLGPATGGSRMRDVFTPSQPCALGPLFVGRDKYLRRLVSAVEEERAHVVLFGDRGRGKTSLANAFADITTDAGYVVLRCSCGASTSFEGLFRTLLAGLPAHLVGPPAAGAGPALLPDGPFGAVQLTQALRRLRDAHVIFVIDEFDRVQDEGLRVHLAEAIKNVSDSAVAVTFFVVGVAQSLDDLLGRHPSIQRNLVALHLAPMADEEIRRLIQTGAAAVPIRFHDDVSAAMVRLARGMPYYSHLLCLFAARAAGARASAEVTAEDLAVAVAEVLAKQEPQLGRLYSRLVHGSAETRDTLLAAARAEADAYGRFTAAALTGVPLETAERVLDDLVAQHGMVGVTAPGGTLYAFAEPALAHYVLFRNADATTAHAPERDERSMMGMTAP